MSDQARTGVTPVGAVVDAIAATIGRIRERFSIDIPAAWWESKDHPDYELVFAAFVVPHRGLVRVADIDADPLAFDQALRELKVCRACGAVRARVVEGKVAGMADCPLGQAVPLETGRTHSDGRPETVLARRGSSSWYADIERTGSRWEWVMRPCADPERRLSAIRARLGDAQVMAGTWAREVDDELTPFHPPGGDR